MKRFLLLAFLLGAPQFAHAHAMLLKSEPAVGDEVSPAPAELVLHFSEGVEPAFSTVVVTDASGAQVQSGAPKVFAEDRKTLHIGLTPLVAGDYKVEWHATSVDTHKTNGHFGFSVKP